MAYKIVKYKENHILKQNYNILWLKRKQRNNL